MDGWRGLGLDSAPNTGNNGVHGSASPLEGLFEARNWLGAAACPGGRGGGGGGGGGGSLSFGSALLAAGVPAAALEDWARDPEVVLGQGARGGLFDALEGLDAPACLAKVT